MTTFYCVRHGKTEFNRDEIFQGGLVDSPLLPEGIEGATLAGKALKSISFDQVVVSPQKRAQDTALAIINQHSEPLTINTLEHLREMTFGEWDGKKQADYENHPQFISLVNAPNLYDPSEFGGETYEALIDRTTNVFRTLATDYPDDTILVVAHGLTLLASLHSLTGGKVADIRKNGFLDNTSITVMEHNIDTDSFTITDWNNTNHLN
ncbi:hypothetical protein CBF34_07965 [Vagococcus penaei]|uniref:Uncharacterized protein n=1 Tax=Vagococcus penaei TaxID=633807 RepID=A0A1Q2D4E1_9ENTE|nr:histidine phosphatase family protein [Vagococcus penaei]AQP53223.1 hypothetical protein BW732_02555 [Vagococcus penaei]RSU01024.1 hypothetical protein CBF34_07965 [Vagococcus penaei]